MRECGDKERVEGRWRGGEKGRGGGGGNKLEGLRKRRIGAGAGFGEDSTVCYIGAWGGLPA